MEFDNDVSLGEGLASDQYDHDDGRQNQCELAQSSGDRNRLIAGLIVSGLLHIAIAVVFVRLSIGTAGDPVPAAIQIQIVPLSLLFATAEQPEQEQAADEEAVIEELQTEQELVESSTAEIEPEQFETEALADAGQTESVESSSSEQLPEIDAATRPAQTLPTLLAIQQSLEAIEFERASRFYAYDCNVMERKEGLRKCEPLADRDFSTLEQNPVYDFHNPVRELSRSEKTVTTVARESRALAGRLDQDGLPSGLSAYVLEEMEAGIQISSNNGNTVLQNMSTMLDRSAAAVQARRVFDPWVQQQTTVFGARMAYNKQELDQQQSCADIAMALLTLPLTEFARCWTVGDKPLLLLNLLAL